MNLLTGRLPNLRELIIPDPGYVIVDMDLKRADMWVTAWEAEDDYFKEQLREEERDPSKDVHDSNCIDIFGDAAYNPDGTINKQKRRDAKVFGHGSDYLAQPPALAKQCGTTLAVAQAAQAKWFAKHPGIPKWHQRVRDTVWRTRSISNKFGYRIKFFDRVDNCIPQACAWVPQSTVALVINKAFCAIAEQLPKVEVLLQVHDSLTMQIPIGSEQELIPQIEALSLIPIPYSDPLTIPVSFSVSGESWGKVWEWEKTEERWQPKTK
jgi:DNA polymerase-1